MQPYANYKGPTTELVIKALKEGKPTNLIGRIGHSTRQAPQVGVTNGAGMRVAPVGLIHPGNISKTCEQVLLTCLPSHDTNIAIASACAIACAVSAALLSDSTLESIVDASIEGAKYGESLARKHARVVAGASIEMRIRLAVSLANEDRPMVDFLRVLEGYVGNSVTAHESIPCAIGIFAYVKGDIWKGIVAAANIGNDTDSIGTMVGAIAGAFQGFETIPQDKFEEWIAVNNRDFDIFKLSTGLTELAEQELACSKSIGDKYVRR